jgi:hypothetical protein
MAMKSRLVIRRPAGGTWRLFLLVFVIFLTGIVVRYPGYKPFEARIEPVGADCTLQLDTGRGLNPVQSWHGGSPVRIIGARLHRARMDCAPARPADAPARLRIQWEDARTPPLEARGPSWDSAAAPVQIPAPHYATPLLRAAQALAALLLTALLFGVAFGVGFVRRGWWRWPPAWTPWLGFVGTALVIFGIWVVAFWPGYFDYDSFAIRRIAYSYHTDNWFSYLLPVYMLAADILVPGFGGAGVIQWLLVSLGAGSVFALAWNAGASRPLLVAAFAALVLLPLNGVNVVFNSRDGIFSILAVATVLSLPLWKALARRRSPSWQALAGIALLVTLTAVMRLEARVFFVAVPLGFLASGAWSRRTFIRFIPILAIAAACGLSLLPALLRVENAKEYVFSAWIGPLGHILAVPHTMPDPETQAALDEVFYVSELKRLDTPYEIPAFHSRQFKKVLTDEDVERVGRAYRKLVLSNPGPFLENRNAMFRAMLGFGPGTYFYEDGLVRHVPFNDEARAQLGLWASDLLPGLRGWLGAFAHFAMSDWDYRPWRVALGTNLLPLLICLALIALYRRAPATAWASAILLSRLPLLFLFAPASHFKYGYSYYLFAPLAVAAFLLESSMRRQTRVEDRE